MTWVAALAVTLAAGACSTDGLRRASMDAGDGAGSGTGSDGAEPDAPRVYADLPPCEPTLDSLRGALFGQACAFENCHGDQPAWGLALLEPGDAPSWIGRRAGTCEGYDLVVPGDPDGSYLYLKVISDHPPCRTQRMPLGQPQVPPASAACLRDWILAL